MIEYARYAHLYVADVYLDHMRLADGVPEIGARIACPDQEVRTVLAVKLAREGLTSSGHKVECYRIDASVPIQPRPIQP